MKNRNWNPRLIRLELGEIYNVSFGQAYKNIIKCKFIMTTRCGYNFLNIKTNKCVFHHHFYPSKKMDPIGEMFFVSKKVVIKKVNI